MNVYTKWRQALCLFLILLMVLSLAACQGGGKETQAESTLTAAETVPPETQTGEETQEETEPPTEPVPTLVVLDDVDTTGYQQADRVWFKLPEDWTVNETAGGTANHVFQLADGDSIAYLNVSFQDGLEYDPDTIEAAYEDAVTANIGAWDGMKEEQIGEYTWRHYLFDKGTAYEDVVADVYLCTDGRTVMYFEFAANGKFVDKLPEFSNQILSTVVLK